MPAALYWLFESPVQMVVMGGVAQAAMLPVIGLAATYLRHRRLPPVITPSPTTTLMLWISTIVMAVFALYYALSRVL